MEETLDLSFDRLLMMMMMIVIINIIFRAIYFRIELIIKIHIVLKIHFLNINPKLTPSP